jgi:hypothetical protein
MNKPIQSCPCYCHYPKDVIHAGDFRFCEHCVPESFPDNWEEEFDKLRGQLPDYRGWVPVEIAKEFIHSHDQAVREREREQLKKKVKDLKGYEYNDRLKYEEGIDDVLTLFEEKKEA